MLSIQIWLYQVFKIVLLFLFLFITVFLAENKLDGCMQVEKKKNLVSYSIKKYHLGFYYRLICIKNSVNVDSNHYM